MLSCRFDTIVTAYFRSAQGILLVYDITNRESFNDLKYWLKEVDRNASQVVNKLLVGNMSDLENRREVDSMEGQEFADSLGFSLIQAISFFMTF